MSNIISDVTRLPSGRFEVTMSNGAKVNLSFSALMIEIGVITLEQSRLAFSTQFNAADDLLKAMQELNDIMQQLNNLKSQFKDDAKGSDTVKDPTVEFKKQPSTTFRYPTQSADGLIDFTKYYPVDNGMMEFMAKLKTLENLTDSQKEGLYAEFETYINLYDKAAEAKDTYKDTDLYKQVETTVDGVMTLNIYDRDYSNTLSSILNKFNKKYPSLQIKHDLDCKEDYTKKDIEAAISNVQAQQSNLSSLTEQQNMRTNQANSRVTGWLQQLQSLLQTLKEALQAAGKTGGM
ncbi:hypothetical protein LJC09_01155 [Desulfovibrio sp. OttesenSCG-928-F20]|nr:hypothetical protein [Desulfovibrio sp. OttesenSCG-928-F20]